MIIKRIPGRIPPGSSGGSPGGPGRDRQPLNTGIDIIEYIPGGSRPKELKTMIKRTDKETSEIDHITEDQAVKVLDLYYKKGTARPMLKEGLRLQTNFFYYEREA